ncbi:MAG: AIR synthase-related protein, partial [Desulfohalobium sp.]
MIARLNVAMREHVQDVQGAKIAREIETTCGVSVQAVSVIQVYTLQGFTAQDCREIQEKAVLHDPVLHEIRDTPWPARGDWIVEVGFKPGVTDNPGRIALQTVHTVLGEAAEHNANIYTAQEYHIRGTLSRETVQRIGRDLLANELIHRLRITDAAAWEAAPGFALEPPEVTGQATEVVETVSLSGLDDVALQQLSQERVLALSPKEMRAIKAYYRREEVRATRQELGLPKEPTDVELECLAQTWSEHCKHKIFNARIAYTNRETGRETVEDSLFGTYIQGSTKTLRRQRGDADFCLSVFKDNAGVIRFNDQHSVCIKVETHNSPSALDPYGGALTGIVGVNRDPMGTGMGANLTCNTDVFCFASPFYEQPLPPRLLHPRRVLEGVREGVEHGGNQSGIPTVNGGLIFDERFLGKPLVFCGTVGMLPAEVNGRPSHEKKALPGDAVVMVGGRIGKDGIHGATFSSEELHAGSPATAVQIGDPITQRKMYDFLMRARDLGLYNALTDNGAGGLSSSVGEMAEDSGGCEIDLALAPLKYDGLAPWEILLSEAQERMTVAVPPDRLETFLALSREMDVESTALGRFTDSGFFHIRYHQSTVAFLEMHFLHHGLPQMELEAIWERPEAPAVVLPGTEQTESILLELLGRLNVCSREYVIRQYDHEVQGGSVVKPLVGRYADGPGDAAVLRPVLESRRGLVVANGIAPKYSDLDTYWMAANCVDEAVRNAVAVGGRLEHMAGIDNFCWCDPVQSEKTPDGRYKLAQLVRANQALAHYCLAFGVPCISGKDSMKNDYYGGGRKISIPPTLLFSVLSVMPDVRQSLTSDLKQPGDGLYLLGRTRPEFGGSELA